MSKCRTADWPITGTCADDTGKNSLTISWYTLRANITVITATDKKIENSLYSGTISTDVISFMQQAVTGRLESTSRPRTHWIHAITKVLRMRWFTSQGAAAARHRQKWRQYIVNPFIWLCIDSIQWRIQKFILGGTWLKADSGEGFLCRGYEPPPYQLGSPGNTLRSQGVRAELWS